LKTELNRQVQAAAVAGAETAIKDIMANYAKYPELDSFMKDDAKKIKWESAEFKAAEAYAKMIAGSVIASSTQCLADRSQSVFSVMKHCQKSTQTSDDYEQDHPLALFFQEIMKPFVEWFRAASPSNEEARKLFELDASAISFEVAMNPASTIGCATPC
jgi:hypothetical protein